jgi:hypothetical protein
MKISSAALSEKEKLVSFINKGLIPPTIVTISGSIDLDSSSSMIELGTLQENEKMPKKTGIISRFFELLLNSKSYFSSESFRYYGS